MDLGYIYRIFYPKIKKGKKVPFSKSSWKFFQIYHILIFKASLKRYKKIKITSCTLSDHQGLKLIINNHKNCTKHTKYGNRTTQYWMKSGSKQKLKRKLKMFWTGMKMKIHHAHIYRKQTVSPKRQVIVLNDTQKVRGLTLAVTYWHAWKV